MIIELDPGMMIRRMSANNSPQDQTANDDANRLANDDAPASPRATTKSPAFNTAYNQNHRSYSRKSSYDRTTHFHSSLRTIESCAAGSLDIYDDDDSVLTKNSHISQHSIGSSSIHRANSIKRRHSLEMSGGGSMQSLMVSFSRLNEQELTHLRKWNRRLHR